MVGAIHGHNRDRLKRSQGSGITVYWEGGSSTRVRVGVVGRGDEGITPNTLRREGGGLPLRPSLIRWYYVR